MTRSVLVIGGGPAGLAASLRLAERGVAVTLAEAEDRLGGRLLNGPLVLFGGHASTRAFLASLGSLRRSAEGGALRMEFALDRRRVALRRPWLPGRLHGVVALAAFRGLSVSDRWRALDLLERSWEGDPALPADLDARSADGWLAERGQSETARTRVWGPLARFFLGNDLATASAAQFVRTLQRHLLASRRAASATVSRLPAHQLLIEPAAARLRDRGAAVRLNDAAIRLELAHDRITGVQFDSGETLRAQGYILALPHHKLCGLLPDRLLTRYAYFEQLTRLTDAPAVVVRLWTDSAGPRRRLVLLSRRTFDWLVASPAPVAQGAGAQVTLVAVDCRPLLHQSDQALFELALADLRHAFPDEGGACTKYDVVRDPHAVLALTPGTAPLRPLPQTPIRNLLLAGTWTDTGHPAMLESAVASGVRAAAAIPAHDG